MNKVLKLILDGENLSTDQMAEILNLSHDEINFEIKKLKDDKILLGFRPVFNPDYISDTCVRALIELKIRPDRDGGFDRLAQRISKFDQVDTCYLLSGGYDLLLSVTTDNLRQVASFVYERLASIEGVESTATHFILRAYKEQGYLINSKVENPDKPKVSP